jgi:hypothetical protein
MTMTIAEFLRSDMFTEKASDLALTYWVHASVLGSHNLCMILLNDQVGCTLQYEAIETVLKSSIEPRVAEWLKKHPYDGQHIPLVIIDSWETVEVTLTLLPVDTSTSTLDA